MAAIFTLIFAINNTIASKNEGMNDDEKAVDINMKKMSEAWKTKNVENYMSFVADDAKIMTGGKNRVFMSKEKFRKHLPKIIGKKRSPIIKGSYKTSSNNDQQVTVKFTVYPNHYAGYINITYIWELKDNNWKLKKTSW